MVQDLQQARELYQRVLGMAPCHGEDLPQYGLTNLVLPAGEGTFVELLQPTSSDSAAARFLARRGEAPYLLIFETKAYDQLLPHLKSLGVRITSETQHETYRSAFIHPASTNGAFMEVIEVKAGFKLVPTANPWPPAGPDWVLQGETHRNRHPLTLQLRQVAVLVSDLDQATERWEEMFGLKATQRHRISFTDLEMAVMPLSDRSAEGGFIELAQPTSFDSPSARFLERYGEGVYLLIFQISDSLMVDAHLKDQGIRYTTSRVTPGYVNFGINSIWLHPNAMKGAFIQLSQVLDPENPWPPAGENWHRGQ